MFESSERGSGIGATEPKVMIIINNLSMFNSSKELEKKNTRKNTKVRESLKTNNLSASITKETDNYDILDCIEKKNDKQTYL